MGKGGEMGEKRGQLRKCSSKTARFTDGATTTPENIRRYRDGYLGGKPLMTESMIRLYLARIS